MCFTISRSRVPTAGLQIDTAECQEGPKNLIAKIIKPLVISHDFPLNGTSSDFGAKEAVNGGTSRWERQEDRPIT